MTRGSGEKSTTDPSTRSKARCAVAQPRALEFSLCQASGKQASNQPARKHSTSQAERASKSASKQQTQTESLTLQLVCLRDHPVLHHIVQDVRKRRGASLACKHTHRRTGAHRGRGTHTSARKQAHTCTQARARTEAHTHKRTQDADAQAHRRARSRHGRGRRAENRSHLAKTGDNSVTLLGSTL